MICLFCGAKQKKRGAEKCEACGADFPLVSGLFGYNNVSQLIHALHQFKAGKIAAEEVQDRFGVFLNSWDDFSTKWGLAERSIPEAFNLKRDLEGVYGSLLQELEESVQLLTDALDKVDALQDGDTDKVDEIEDAVRLFSRRACSASAGIFTKLESRSGDFSSLLDAFGGF